MLRVALAMAIGYLVVSQTAGDAPDLAIYARIKDEGNTRSRVMEYAAELVDGIGPRLTGSPNLKRATAWSVDRLTQMGLSNVRAESWGEFGFGWQQRGISMRMIEPDVATFIVAAAPWSPATPGPVTGDVIAVRGFTDEREFAVPRGKLRGKIVLLGQAPGMPDVTPIDQPLFERRDDERLAAEARNPGPPAGEFVNDERMFAQVALRERSGRFFADEGALAVIAPSGNHRRGGISGGTMWVDHNAAFVGMFAYRKEHAMRVPLVIVTNEHYGRMKRLLDRNVPVTVELNVDVEFTGDREEAFNVFGDIAGVDPQRKDELVMVGAHLDSWAAGTGATDDGAGVVIVMEAMRILRALEVRPKRTIRIALWTGEEQGVLGSMEYARRHVAEVPRSATPAQMNMPAFMRLRTGRPVLKPDHARISAVYNVDAGGGRIRAMALGPNPALPPIFKPWVAPLADIGVTDTFFRETCGGDCHPFADVGIPAISFTQDPLDYVTRTLHTNMDTFEHLIPEDLRQAAIVVAVMVYNTAMRDAMLPRTP